MYAARARLAGRRRIDALVPLQIRWHSASGGRRTAAAVLALLPLSLAAAVGVSLLPSAEGEPPSAPSAASVSDGVPPDAAGRPPAREGNPSGPQPRNAASAAPAAGLAGVGVRSAATGLASAPEAPSRSTPDAGGAPDAGDAPDSGGSPNFGGPPDPGGVPNSAPSPPQDFDSDGRPNGAPRAHVPSGGGPGTREPSGGAPRPSAPSGDDGAAPQPGPALPLPVPFLSD